MSVCHSLPPAPLVAVRRRLAARLGSAVREARRHLPPGDEVLVTLKGALGRLGALTRPQEGKPFKSNLELAPPRAKGLLDLFEALAVRPSSPSSPPPPSLARGSRSPSTRRNRPPLRLQVARQISHTRTKSSLPKTP